MNHLLKDEREMYEKSKLDNHIIVGSDIRILCSRLSAARERIAELEAAESREEALRERSRKLMREVDALKAFEMEVVEVIGWSNWRCLQMRRDEVEAALAPESKQNG